MHKGGDGLSGVCLCSSCCRWCNADRYSIVDCIAFRFYTANIKESLLHSNTGNVYRCRQCGLTLERCHKPLCVGLHSTIRQRNRHLCDNHHEDGRAVEFRRFCRVGNRCVRLVRGDDTECLTEILLVCREDGKAVSSGCCCQSGRRYEYHDLPPFF